MNNFNRISASAFLAAASLAISADSWALGLGDAKVESFLNQPLRARIDLVTQETDDVASVTAQLASAADYEMIGASRESVSVPIHFTVEDVDGDAYLLATSRLPIGDPVVRLIVEVNWSSGRMLREYTLFLDPPSVPDTPPAPRVDERPAARPAAAAAPVETPSAAPAPKAAPAAAPAQLLAGGGKYGPVKSGETLWGIASAWSSGSGMDVNRVMIAIQRANPSAFLKNNINLLKRGAILRMPAMEEVSEISSATANSEVRSQAEEFAGQRASGAASAETPLLAGESAASPAADVTDAASPLTPAEEPESPAAAVDAEAETTENEAAEAGQDQLELVPPSSDSGLDSTYGFEESEETGTAGESVQALREDLARTEEELYNQKQQNSYLEDRIKELQSQLESAEQGNVADSDAANMEQRLREERQVDQQERARLAANSAAEEPNKPWYSRFGLWLIGLLVVIAALAGWIISRRGSGSGVEAAAASPSDSLRDIKDEAEQVLRVLEEPEESDTEAEPEPETESGAAPEAEADSPETDEKPDEGAPEEEKPGKPAAPQGDDDAELLDEESSDPEIQLDLARAYISMGDKEAARVILEEVLANGSEEQQEDARKMLDVLKS
ncbi:MAG: FimV/HubP family polar landmark protein [Lysobacterales bacterium]|jgi:pilus assembly protein FimV